MVAKKNVCILITVSLSMLAGAQQIPGVVTSKTAVFAPAPDGGIEAIDLAKGTILWTSRNADWPFGFGSDKVVALTDPQGGNQVAVTLINPDGGGVVAQLGPVQLPEWVKAKFGYGEKKSNDFSIWVDSAWRDGMNIHWKAQRWSPVTLSNYRQRQTLQQAGGRILIDFTSNRVEAHNIPPDSPPQARDIDKSLPLLRGEKALASDYAGNNTIALIKKGKDVYLECFRDRMLVWSVPVRS